MRAEHGPYSEQSPAQAGLRGKGDRAKRMSRHACVAAKDTELLPTLYLEN